MFAVPSLQACVGYARNAFRAYLPGTDAWLPVNNVGPTAKVVGGAVSMLFGRLDFIARQSRVVTASGKYLRLHGAQYGLAPKGAAPASGNAVITAPAALTIANGAQLARSDGAVLVAAAATSLPGAGAVSIPVVAAVAAAAGNTQPGAPLTILSGVTGDGSAVATAAVDGAGLSGGLDAEVDGPPYARDLSTFRGRILQRLAYTPQGGAPADYVTWCGAVPGVTRTFVERLWQGPGTVRVFPLFDGIFAAQGGAPDDAHLALVAAAVAAVQPAAAAVAVVAAVPYPIDVAVQGLTPNTAAAQRAVLDELFDTFQRLGQVAGADPASAAAQAAMPFLAVPYSFAALWIEQAVANAAGNKRAVVRAPLADVVIPAGAVPVLGTVQFS